MSAAHTVDDFGFTEYAVVLHAHVAQLNMVRAFRHSIGLCRAMYDAHVTVKGTFRSVTDLSVVRMVVEHAAKHESPFAVEFAGAPYEVMGGGLFVPVHASSLLRALHLHLGEALRCLSHDVYQMPVFRPHLTLCYGCTSEQLAKAKELVADLALGLGFTARALDLMARTGDPLRGGYCTLIDSFPLGDSTIGRYNELRAFYRTSPSPPKEQAFEN